MDTDTISPPDALTDLRGVKLGAVRACFAPERYQRRLAPTFGWLAADAGAYLACLAVILAADNRLVQLAAALAAGLAVSACFVWAHDAAHGALFAGRRTADVLGAVAMLPSLHVYRLWQHGHNRVHHGFTNLTPIDWIWRPWAPAEYRAAGPAGRAFYRAERTLPGCGLHYLVRVWWDGMVRHPGSRAGKALVLAFGVGLGFAGFAWAGGPLGALLVLVVPFLVFTWVIALVVYLHHTAPDIPFFPDRASWHAVVGKLCCTTTIRMSRPAQAVLHNICIHVPHHVDTRIPFYNLPAAQDDLTAAYGSYLHDRRFRWSTVLATFRACKLYDYETRRWTAFGPPRPRRALGALGAVLAIVLLAAGCGGDKPGSDLPAVSGPVSPALEVHATEMQYEPDAIAVKAGNVQVVLHNDGTVLHDLRIEDQPFVIEAPPGQTVTSQLPLEAGRYQIFCSIPGHREAGMTGVLEVR